MNKIFYTYHDLILDVRVIHDTYMSKCTAAPDFIVGIARGGLVPAVHLSHMFNVPLVPLRWSTRDHVGKDFGMLDNLVYRAERGQRLLIVDDIFDSGDTLSDIASLFGKYDETCRLPVYATLIANNTTKKFAKFIEDEVLIMGSYMNKTESEWVVFPWES